MKLKNKNYFNEDIVHAIELFNNCDTDDHYKRNLIFNKDIYPVLHQLSYKIAYKILNKKLLLYSDTSYDDIISECVIHLYKMCLHNYQPNLGRAFSYFTRSAINFMAGVNEEIKKNITEDISVVDFKYNIDADYSLKESLSNLYEFTELFISVYDVEMEKIYKGDQLIIVDAILEIFKTREHIQDYEKTALYIFIREITGLPTQRITPVMKRVRDHFYKLYKNYLNTNTVDLNLLKRDYLRGYNENN